MNVYAISNSQGDVYGKYEINNRLEKLGIPTDVIAKGEAAIEEYASENQITLPSSDPKEVKAPQPKIAGSAGKNKEEFEAKLLALGIPQATVEQGKDAVVQYAAQNNIQLPAPPTKGSQLNKLG